MTATERLHAMLDERGVEWTGSDTRTGFIVDGIDWEVYEHVVFGEPSGLLSVMTTLTPAQAVEATLGRGTCNNTAPSYLDFLCSECGFVHYHSDANDSGDGNEWRFCPDCGRKVVDA